MFWAFALANLKHDAEALWAWLCHRSFWQLVSMGLAIFALVQHFQLIDARHDAAAWKKQHNAVQTELTKLSAQRNTQKVETQTRIVKVKEQIRHADDQAKKIEQAPLPGNCKTPKEVLDADI